MIVQFVNQQTRFPVKDWKELLRQVLPAAVALLPFGRELERHRIEAQLTIIFAGPNVIRRVNRETRKIDRRTDVLSFPLLYMSDGRLSKELEAADFDLSSTRLLSRLADSSTDMAAAPAKNKIRVLPLGEIMISLDQAFAQAIEYGHPDEREVAFMVIHGLLHLLGFDHQNKEQEKTMQKWQRQILREAGLELGGRFGDRADLTAEDEHS